MTLQYHELSSLCDSLHDENADVYAENITLRETNRIISARNVELELLAHNLNKQIIKGYIN